MMMRNDDINKKENLEKKLKTILKESLDHMKNQGVNIDSKLEKIAKATGLHKDDINVVKEVFANESINSGVLVKAHCNMWRARLTLTPEIMGLKEFKKEEVRKIEKDLVKYQGHLFLIPKDYILKLESIETKARLLIKAEGTKFEPYGDFIPYTHLDTFSEKASELQKEFNKIIDDIVTNYNVLVAAMQESHKKLIEAIYKRKESIEDHLDISMDTNYHKFRDLFLTNIQSFIRSKEYIQSHSKLTYDYFIIDSKISSQINEAKKRLIDQIENITKEAFKEVVEQDLITQNASLEDIQKELSNIDNLSKDEISNRISNLDVEKKEKVNIIKDRKEKLNRMKNKVLATQEKESNSSTGLSLNFITALRYELFACLVELLDSTKKKEVYHGKTINKLVAKLDKLDGSMFFKDSELEFLINQLRVVPLIKQSKEKIDEVLVLASTLLRKQLADFQFDISKLKCDLNELKIKLVDYNEEESIKKLLASYGEKYLPKNENLTFEDVGIENTKKTSDIEGSKGDDTTVKEKTNESEENNMPVKPNLNILAATTGSNDSDPNIHKIVPKLGILGNKK